MTSLTKERSDPADNALRNPENEAPNDCSTNIQPLFADSNIISQMESNPVNRELDTPTSQEHDVPQVAENNELKIEKTQKHPQKEDRKEECLLIQIPIPRKWIFHNPLTNRTRFYSGKVEMKTSNFCHSIINYKIPLQLSISWRNPFINNHEMRRMIHHLLCGRHFSQPASLQNTVWVKQKYTAFLPRQNVLTHVEKAIILRRPLKMYYYHTVIERLTAGKFYKSTDTKGKDEFHIFARPVFCVPSTQIQGTFNGKDFEDHLRSHYNRKLSTACALILHLLPVLLLPGSGGAGNAAARGTGFTDVAVTSRCLGSWVTPPQPLEEVYLGNKHCLDSQSLLAQVLVQFLEPQILGTAAPAEGPGSYTQLLLLAELVLWCHHLGLAHRHCCSS
ncbi:LOW QUALITY PROTEIN: CPX chromosomal region candidate gene 1 protein [Equus asinus]|uniref:LOW QUALITY PROTEIN: CPX chromosomal region candidate gene 1 protein n=1 Tax=Equus asinus TaxID=9793 RepID=UPI00071A137F